VAIASSLVLNFSIEVFDISIPGGLHGGTLSLLVSTVLFLGISLASKRPEIDPDVEAIMDL
jgi:sodium/proline symporter/sodium/pantothenate symporter